MKSRTVYIGAGAVGLLIGAGALVGTAAFAGAPHEPDDYDLGALQKTMTSTAASDALPEHLDVSMIGDGDIDGETLRELTSTEDAQYLTGLNAAGELCLIVSIYNDDEDWGVATSCSAPTKFNSHGVGLVVGTATTEVEGYLIPDGSVDEIETAGISDTGATVRDNLVIIDPSDSEADRQEIARALAPAGVLLIPSE
jgi:hypothetical protein